MLGSISVAAATAVLDFDLMRDNVFKQSTHPRVLKGAALAGSAAAGDAKVVISKGSVKIAELYNTATGFPTTDHLFGIGEYIGANDEISAVVTDAPATNPLNLVLDFAGG